MKYLAVLAGRDSLPLKITYKAVEAAEGRTAHNNGWNGANGMASNTQKPCI